MHAFAEEALIARVQRGDVQVPAFPKSAESSPTCSNAQTSRWKRSSRSYATDDVLAATTLRLANSVFYARGDCVDTVSSAVMRIGANELHRVGVASGSRAPLFHSRPARSLAPPRLAPGASSRRESASSWRRSPAIRPRRHFSPAHCTTSVACSPSRARRAEAAAQRRRSMGARRSLSRRAGHGLAARWKLPAALEEIIADHHVRDAQEHEVVLRRVQASDRVCALLDEVPAVTAERLGGVPFSPPRSARRSRSRFPRCPSGFEAFAPESADANGPVAPLKPPFVRPISTARRRAGAR